MMSKIFVRSGNATIDVSPKLERLVNRLLDANPIIKKAMIDSIEDIYQDAYKRWPNYMIVTGKHQWLHYHF